MFQYFTARLNLYQPSLLPWRSPLLPSAPTDQRGGRPGKQRKEQLFFETKMARILRIIICAIRPEKGHTEGLGERDEKGSTRARGARAPQIPAGGWVGGRVIQRPPISQLCPPSSQTPHSHSHHSQGECGKVLAFCNPAASAEVSVRWNARQAPKTPKF
jgi:hypothetical protein